jgi:hypothetical protein
MLSLEDLEQMHEQNIANRAKYKIKRPDIGSARKEVIACRYACTGDQIEEFWDHRLFRTHYFSVYKFDPNRMGRNDSTKYELTTTIHGTQGEIPDIIWKGQWKGMSGFYYYGESPPAYKPPYQDGDWGIYKENSALEDEYTKYLLNSKLSKSNDELGSVEKTDMSRLLRQMELLSRGVCVYW